MKKRTFASILFSIGFIALLILFPTISIKGSKAGLLLWFQVLLPTLLPFFILSSLLRILLPKKKNTALFIGIGLFSGYPLGAKIVGEEYTLGRLSYKNSIFFLSFCNQASAIFILVYVGIHVLRLGTLRYVFFLIVLCSTLIGCFIGSRLLRPKSASSPDSLNDNESGHIKSLSFTEQLDQIILESFITLTKIGGYVILFSILASFILSITRENPYVTVMFSGFLEITTGASSLHSASIPPSSKIVLASALTTFGGCSAIAQTQSVISKTGLSIYHYVFCKILSAFFAILMSNLFLLFLN